MSTFRRRMMQQASENIALPEGCTRLACLVSTGTQWIDTEHICQADEDICIDFGANTSYGVSYSYIMGWRNSGSISNPYQLGVYYNQGKSVINLYVGTPLSNRLSFSDSIDRMSILISPNKKEIYVNGVAHTSNLIDWTAPYGGGNSNFLFNFNLLGVAARGNQTYAEIYEYWVKDKDGNFVQHLIPILDTNNVPCMLDLVNGKFHYNMGSGVFLYGLNEPFIINHSNAYIDTLIQPSINASIGTKYNLFYKNSDYPSPFGTGGGLNNRFENIFDVTYKKQVLHRWGVSYTNYPPSIYDIFEVGMYPDKFILNDVIVYEGIGTNVYDKNMYLFKTSRNDSSNFCGIIYSFRMFEGDTLVRDFVPHRQDGEWGMLDKVENKFYTSLNGEKFGGYIPNEQ